MSCWADFGLFFGFSKFASIHLVNGLPGSGNATLFNGSTGHLFFPASRFPCPCCLNTADDTSDWEKFEIMSDFDFFQRQRNSELIPSTVFKKSWKLICRCWSLLCLSAGRPDWPIASLRKQTCQIVLCVHDNLWEIWSPSFLSSVTYFSAFASREQSLTIRFEKSLISNLILTDSKDINVRFICSRFWELVVTRYTDVSLGVFYCASFIPNPVVNSFSRRVVEQDYSIVLRVF